jgi:DNA-3-methyladenine glycosylase II
MRYRRPNVTAVPQPLTRETLALAVERLAGRDPDLEAIAERLGPPPLWDRPEGFATLVQIVLEQQVSLSSARAAFDRLVSAVGELTPPRFLGLDDARLLEIGFSRQKAGYVRDLARAVESGELDLDGLAGLTDEAASESLLALRGIGPWTASIYLLMAMGRPDVWPATDMALVAAVARIKGLDRRPDAAQMSAIAEPWRPWRSVAARLLWHDYLSRRGQGTGSQPEARQ